MRDKISPKMWLQGLKSRVQGEKKRFLKSQRDIEKDVEGDEIDVLSA